MKKRTRAWRRWVERGTRWGLTTLLLALVGVTVASGRWRFFGWVLVPTFDAELPTLGLLGDLRRGNLELDAGASPEAYSPACTIRTSPDPRWEGPSCTDTPPPASFNLWRISHDGARWSVSMTYPTLAAALPTLFLWRRHRRYRRKLGLCHKCGYDLAGLAAVEERLVCPECGAVNVAGRDGGRTPMLKAKTP